MIPRRSSLLALGVVMLGVLAAVGAPPAPAEDRIMVQVGSGAISYADLQDEARYWRLAEVADDRMERLFFALLDRRILLAALGDLPPAPEDLDRAHRTAEATITRFEQRYGGVEGFHAVLLAYDWDLMRLRAFLEARSLENARIRRLIVARLRSATPAEVAAFAAERRAAGLPSDLFRLRHIVVRAADPTRPDEVARARERIADAELRLRGGAPFEQVAGEVSDDPLTRLAGGYVGVLSDLELRPELLRALEPAREGALAGPVEVEGVWYLMQVLERRTPAQMLAARRFEEARREVFVELRPKVPIHFVDAELKELGFPARYAAYARRQREGGAEPGDAPGWWDGEGESAGAGGE